MGADANEFFCPAVQVIFYLDDVDHENHCTSVIPESAETKRSLPTTRGPLERDGRHHVKLQYNATLFSKLSIENAEMM